METAMRKKNPEPTPEIIARLEKVVLRVFSEGDFHQANMRAIAKEAGISFRTIYKYFHGKEGLLFFFIDYWLQALITRMNDHILGLESLKEKLRKLFWVQLDFYERNPQLAEIIFLTVPLKTWMADQTFRQRNMMDLFTQLLKQGQDEGILRRDVGHIDLMDAFFALMLRSLATHFYRGQRQPLTAQAGVFFDILWRGIKAEDNQPG